MPPGAGAPSLHRRPERGAMDRAAEPPPGELRLHGCRHAAVSTMAEQGHALRTADSWGGVPLEGPGGAVWGQA